MKVKGFRSLFVALTAIMMVLVLLVPSALAATTPLRYTDFQLSENFSKVTIGGKTYPTHIFVTSWEGGMVNANSQGALYLTTPIMQGESPDKFFSYWPAQETRKVVADPENAKLFPKFESITIGGKPWQNTEFKQAILDSLTAANPTLKDKILEFYSDPSNNGYAYYVFEKGMSIQDAKKQYPLQNRTMAVQKRFLIENHTQYTQSTSDADLNIQVQMPYGEFLKKNSVAGPGQTPVGTPAEVPSKILLQLNNPQIQKDYNGRVETVTLDVAPIISERYYTLVPIRGVMEAMGATVTYIPEGQKVYIERGNLSVEFAIGSNVAYVNKSTKVIMPEPARLQNDRTLIPLRFVSENLGMNVTWFGDTQEIMIEPPK